MTDAPQDPLGRTQRAEPRTPLEKFNASRATRGLSPLTAYEANHRNDLLQDLDSATTPEERERLRKLIHAIDRPEEARAAERQAQRRGVDESPEMR